MPALGMAQEKGTLVNWLKAEGDPVVRGEPIMEVETDKATVEVEAPASGTLANVSANAGDEIPVGQTIAVILAPGEAAPAETKKSTVAAAVEKRREKITPAIAQPGEKRVDAGTPRATGRILASPAAKRIAREKSIDLAALKGSGPEGAVLAEDVLRAEQTAAPKPTTEADAGQTLPLSPMRRIVGQRMTQSKQSAPHFYVSIDVDMTAVSQLRNEQKNDGEKLIPSINDFILQACAQVLKDFPSLNASFTEQGIQLHSDINIGMAVALEEGLVVPVIRNAQRLSLPELAQQSRDLIDKAQKKKLFPLDYEGGTFPVSNLGMLGADSFVAIINPPQCAILAVGRVAPRPVADGDKIVIRSTMTATLSADHRIVDGAIAARFLQEVKNLLEDPVL